MFKLCNYVTAMGVMIVWAIILLAEDKGEGHPQPAHITKLPQLFGVCVYSFMCHHSLPALITPINEKKSILRASIYYTGILYIFFC